MQDIVQVLVAHVHHREDEGVAVRVEHETVDEPVIDVCVVDRLVVACRIAIEQTDDAAIPTVRVQDFRLPAARETLLETKHCLIDVGLMIVVDAPGLAEDVLVEIR